MKKFIQRSLIAAFVCTFSFSVVGCNRGGETADDSKSQLFVATFDGGFGSAWMDKIEERFEAKYANTSFEPGKVGVQIISKPEREMTNEVLLAKLEGMTHEVIFTEAINYYELQSSGLLYDISEAVTKPLNWDFVTGAVDASDPETQSIQDKMSNSAHKEYFGANGKYYGLPFYEATYGIVYDIDLFEANKLYFNEAGTDLIRKSDEKRSKGPDGDFGTDDDGLPATYDDFFKLCDAMVSMGITPITWNGVSPYVNALVESLQADYEGAEQMRINYSSSGTATNLVKEFDADGNPVLESQAITAENGYLTWTKQAGKYYGLKFAEQLTANTNYYDKAQVMNSTYTQTEAQNALVMDRFIQGKKPVAMLVDGSWWLNEAKDSFTAAAERFGAEAGLQGRKFGFMPLPKATADKVGEKYSVMEVNSSVCFVRGNVDTKKDALIKEFIQFCHTEESLREFTSITYTTKPFTYTMSDAEVNAMPFWGQEMYRLHNESAYVSGYSTAPIYKLNASKYTQLWTGTMFESLVAGETYKDVTIAMIPKEGKKTVTAREYFEGLAAGITADEWKNDFIPQ